MKYLLLFFLCFFAWADEGERAAEELGRFREETLRVIRGIQDQWQDKAGDSAGIWRAQEKVMMLATDRRFLSSLAELWNHPQRKTLLWVELGFFLIMLVVKAWRQSKAKNWFTKFLVGCAFGILTWLGMVLVLPAILLGEPFRVVALTAWRLLNG